MPVPANLSPLTAPVLGAGLIASYAATSGAASIAAGGTAQQLCAANEVTHGLYVENPLTAAEQGISTAELLYVDWINTAGTTSGTSVHLQPGDTLTLNAAPSGAVTVYAATTGHKFTAFIW